MGRHLEKNTRPGADAARPHQGFPSLIEVPRRGEVPEERDLLALYIKQIARYPVRILW